MSLKVKFVEGIRVHCAKCKKGVTPYLHVHSDDATGLTTTIEAVCMTCHAVVKAFK